MPPKRGGLITRPTSKRNTNPKILIVCEGTKTEPNYFDGFEVYGLNIDIEGAGKNTDSLVQHAIKLKSDAKKDGTPYDSVYCVFDRDSFPLQNYERAFQLAKQNDVIPIYTNESFELWYLLHFNLYTSALSRTQYGGMLTNLLGKAYSKNATDMYQILLGNQNTAIRNARNLNSVAVSGGNPSHRTNPSTNVYELVEFLNKHLRK